MERVTTPVVEWAVASRPLESDESGDACFVQALPEATLVGVVDGIGHGPAAAAASRAAVRLLADSGLRHPIDALRRCHEGLRATRGAVLTLAWIDGSRDHMTWLAVGNVQGVLLRADHGAGAPRVPLVGRGGVVGRLLPPLRAHVETIAPDDLLVLATDGIHPDFAQRISGRDSAQRVADAIMAQHRTGADDALVVAVRYRGAFA